MRKCFCCFWVQLLKTLGSPLLHVFLTTDHISAAPVIIRDWNITGLFIYKVWSFCMKKFKLLIFLDITNIFQIWKFFPNSYFLHVWFHFLYYTYLRGVNNNFYYFYSFFRTALIFEHLINYYKPTFKDIKEYLQTFKYICSFSLSEEYNTTLLIPKGDSR